MVTPNPADAPEKTPETPEYYRGAIAALEELYSGESLLRSAARVNIVAMLESYRAQLRVIEQQHDWTPAFQAPYNVCRVCGVTESAADQPCSPPPIRMGYLALVPDPNVLKDPEFAEAKGPTWEEQND